MSIFLLSHSPLKTSPAPPKDAPCIAFQSDVQGFHDPDPFLHMVSRISLEDMLRTFFGLYPFPVQGKVGDQQKGTQGKLVAVASHEKSGAFHFNGLRAGCLDPPHKVLIKFPKPLVRRMSNSHMIGSFFFVQDICHDFLNEEVGQGGNF